MGISRNLLRNDVLLSVIADDEGGMVMRCYDVALWRYWPSLFPGYVGYVQASSAFAAVEAMMRLHNLWRVGYAAACSLDRSDACRVHDLFVCLAPEPVYEWVTDEA
jgi:hypothetical protein